MKNKKAEKEQSEKVKKQIKHIHPVKGPFAETKAFLQLEALLETYAAYGWATPVQETKIAPKEQGALSIRQRKFLEIADRFARFILSMIEMKDPKGINEFCGTLRYFSRRAHPSSGYLIPYSKKHDVFLNIVSEYKDGEKPRYKDILETFDGLDADSLDKPIDEREVRRYAKISKIEMERLKSGRHTGSKDVQPRKKPQKKSRTKQ
jgi:hypothetical protein